MTNYVKPLYYKGFLPQTIGKKTFIFSHKPIYLLPHNLYRIDLGLWIPYLPKNKIIYLKNIHPKFNLLNNYVMACCDELRLIVMAIHPVIIEPQQRLCEICFEWAHSLYPRT